jgi:hypothetical protein
MVAKQIKSRRFHRTINVDEEGIFTCPRQKNRPQMTVPMCLNRQAKRFRGCVTCRVPQQIERKKS